MEATALKATRKVSGEKKKRKKEKGKRTEPWLAKLQHFLIKYKWFCACCSG